MSITNSLFITERYLKDNTAFNNAIDVTELLPHILISQDIYIQPVLGSKLYNKLKSQVELEVTTPGTLTADEISLLKLVRPALAQYTYYRALPFIYAKTRSKGVMKGETETASSAEFDEMKYLRDDALNTAEFYTQRIQDYLCENGNKFSEYINPDNPISPNYTQSYSCDLHLDLLNGMSVNDKFNINDLQFYKYFIK